MFVKLHRIRNNNDSYYLTEVVVNVSHVSFMSENREYKMALMEGKMDIKLNTNAEFTDIYINRTGQSEKFTVIGSVELIESKINKTTKKLLRD